MDKAEIDVLKAKLRRLEEENKRKDKCIDELTDYATSVSCNFTSFKKQVYAN